MRWSLPSLMFCIFISPMISLSLWSQPPTQSLHCRVLSLALCPGTPTPSAFSIRTALHEIASLLQYAVERGVVIVPEFDMPAFQLWEASHPEIMVSGGKGCSPRLFQHGDTLDPTKDATYRAHRFAARRNVADFWRKLKSFFALRWRRGAYDLLGE